MSAGKERESVTRRDFLAGGASAALLLAAGAEEVRAQAPAAKPAGPPVNCAVIGLGPRGREILAALGRVPGARITAICDTYQPFLNRSRPAAPNAAAVPDYRLILSRTDVQAVFIATPSHQHREIALAAIQAEKNVFCEAPLAHTMEDARVIAAAGKASRQVFQVGQQLRANPQHKHVLTFIRGNALGKNALGRAQWHRKTSWRSPAPTPEREREVNWRLRKETSPGLVGEIGIHALDSANWFWRSLPVAVTGSGGVLFHQDGRSVPDTVQCVLEYPGDARFIYDATLANSFDGSYEVFMGSDAALLLRDARAWMFKEADSPLQGWEVYARKEQIGDENGIVLVADATQLLALGKIPGKDKSTLDAGKDALFYSVEAFLNCIREKKAPACGPVEGFHATVTALKANEAVQTASKIVFQKEWFDL